ncbi:MAG TPA: ligase-associated DNA damage response exonuclease [Steroidobacteraceae bacterium]|nr:ligase-associated DNA damage response exonuclease [Steroidobacteraceae bacterium]
MSSDPEHLVTVTANGLYCPAGDFHIDPWKPVPTALITHAHGDHLRHGSTRYIVARPGAPIAKLRLGSDQAVTPVDYGARLTLGATTVSLHPAGHILGSAQVRIEHAGRVWVVSGDYKRQEDPTCAAFEQLECDVFISEATFALPVYRWPSTRLVAQEIVRWWHANRERGLASALFCYALGKSQRVLAELGALTAEPVYVHGAVDSLVGVYRRAGVGMLPTLSIPNDKKTDFRGALILAPPSAAGTPWMRRFGEHATGFCSGWMRVRGDRRRRGYDRGFVISDHADWPALLRTCRATKARRILLTHGHSDALARYLTEHDMPSSTLKTDFGAEE